MHQHEVWTDLDLLRVSLAGGQEVVAKAAVPDRRTTSAGVHFLESSSCVSVCRTCGLAGLEVVVIHVEGCRPYIIYRLGMVFR